MRREDPWIIVVGIGALIVWSVVALGPGVLFLWAFAAVMAFEWWIGEPK
jgi:hypothetical protein